MAVSLVGEGDLVYSTRDVALRNGMQGSDIWVVVHGAVHDVTKYEKGDDVTT
jgi:cytochrome b involved in lipid metabolism